MSDMFDDDDLFAPRPTPSPPPPAIPPRKTRPSLVDRMAANGALKAAATVPAFIGPRWPVASLACYCGALDEVREPCPDRLDCWKCHGLETMARRVPAFLPPRHGGRALTDHERRGLALDR